MTNSIEKQRLISLLEFVKQSMQIKNVLINDFTKYKTLNLTENQILDLPGIKLNQSINDEEIWFSIERLQKSEPPKVEDKLLQLWLDFGKKYDKAPTLKSSVNLQQLQDIGYDISELGGTEKDTKLAEQHINFQDFTDKVVINESLAKYIENDWQNWLTAEKKIRTSMDIYANLFNVTQLLQGNLSNVEIELVWGVGVATWQYNENTAIRYPLLTQRADIRLNQDTMVIDILPSQSNVRLETDPFLNLDNLNLKELAQTTKNYFANSEFPFSPFNIDSFKPIILSATSLLDSQGQYVPIENNPERIITKPQSNLVIDDTWVLMARPRNNGVILQDLERFAELAEQAELTGAISAIVTNPKSEHSEITLPSYRGLYAVDGDEQSQKPKELYFPKAYNNEQVQIIQKLEVYDGVVVQGPPGTGKTHTIANVICHYLALGKRVLVTSMKDPALAVLRDKLPEDIRPLAISLLTSETDGLKQFEHSITKISSEISTINRHEYEKEIKSLEQDIDKIHADLALTDNEISRWVKLNLDEVTLEGKKISPIEIAQEVVANQGIADWLPDTLGFGEAFAPKFNNDNMIALQQARQEIGKKLNSLHSTFPDSTKLPSQENILKLHDDLSYLNQTESDEKLGVLPNLSQHNLNIAEIVGNLESLSTKIDTLNKNIQTLKQKNHQWLDNFQAQINLLSKAEIVRYFIDLKKEIAVATSQRTAFITKPVSISDEFDNNKELLLAIENLTQGKKPFGIAGLFGKSNEKTLLNDVKILNVSPETSEEWQYVLSYLKYRKDVKALITRWNAIAPELGLSQQTTTVENIAVVNETGEIYDEIQKNTQLESSIHQQIATIFENCQTISQLPYTAESLAKIKLIASRYLKKYKLQHSIEVKENLLSYLAQYSSELNHSFIEFIDKKLGNETIKSDQIQEEWANLSLELKTLESLKPAFDTVKKVTSLIANSGATIWANQLQQIPAQENDDLLPTNWQKSWRVKQLQTYVESIDSRQALKDLTKIRADLEDQLAQKYQQTIVKRTWLNVAENATPNVKQALEAYRSAIRRIGRGTGKRVPIYVKAAQEASALAGQAIPCWIMPHYKISESLPTKFADFDLVIIDEASQSDLSALPALMRAKKVLIVGDDKQVAPDTVGFEVEKIKALISRHLSNHVTIYRDQMSPDRSIYDLFKVVFAESGVMLKEHFRCVAPIIEFSKREFYNHELNPLRKPLPSEMLDPPLIDVYVKDGFREGKVNSPEVHFIINEIKNIVNNPIYKGRSIGVVSLLGNEQAYKIMEMISSELGEEVINEYEIACGDARTFQGKEKDIIFLSMIVTKENVTAIGRDDFAQRINVATSRARDRMYLVRSVNLEDLSQADVYRAKLIQHFQAPFLIDEQTGVSQRDKCDSDFEREMFDTLSERGYKVITQVKVGKFRIDMVVEGENDNSLAIECDGDRYHGPDKWEQDRNRQRILERAGWIFWRCFASTFVMNREQVIQELTSKLSELNIYPIEHSDNPSKELVEYHEVVGMADENLMITV